MRKKTNLLPYLMATESFSQVTTLFAQRELRSAKSSRPNIILFMVDDMGWQDTSVPFGPECTPLNNIYETPHMERLAREGMMFTQAYASAISSPIRCSLMTGANAARHRVTVRGDALFLKHEKTANHNDLIPSAEIITNFLGHDWLRILCLHAERRLSFEPYANQWVRCDEIRPKHPIDKDDS